MESDGVPINIHSHDFNLAINKLIKERGSINQNDVWHDVKKLKKRIEAVAKGPAYKLGKTWHPQLEDKAQSIAIHSFFACRNCKKNPEQLQRRLLNIVDHYKNIHDNCTPLSRCRLDPNYEPSKKVYY